MAVTDMRDDKGGCAGGEEEHDQLKLISELQLESKMYARISDLYLG